MTSARPAMASGTLHTGPPTRAETLVAALAREITDGDVIATGVASFLPILAITVARLTHAPNATYLACVGALDPEIKRLAPSAESLRYLEGRRGNVSIAGLFDHACRGRIDVMFFSAAEIDSFGNTNMSSTGSLTQPIYKFPGVAGAATLRRLVKRPILLVPRASRRNLVPRVQVASTRDRARRTPLFTDLGVFEVGAAGARLKQRHPWSEHASVVASTGFPFTTDRPLAITPPPGAGELEAIRAIDADGICERLVATPPTRARNQR